MTQSLALTGTQRQYVVRVIALMPGMLGKTGGIPLVCDIHRREKALLKFPGGKSKIEDKKSIIATALRELEEETGISSGDIYSSEIIAMTSEDGLEISLVFVRILKPVTILKFNQDDEAVLLLHPNDISKKVREKKFLPQHIELLGNAALGYRSLILPGIFKL